MADSIKVALGFGNWAQRSYCLVVTWANNYIVLHAQMPNAQWPMPNGQFPMPKEAFIESTIQS